MFYTDWFFLLLLIGLPALSFLSIDPPSLRYSPELFFSALGSASIVVLAWERFANSRMDQLRRLMEHVYLDGGQIKLYQNLRSVCNHVRLRYGLAVDSQNKLQHATSILERRGRFHRVDHLYPKKVIGELHSLSERIGEYVKDWDDCRTRIIGFDKNEPRGVFQLVWAIVKGQVELREQEGMLVPYLKGSTRKADAYAALDGDSGKRVVAFVEKLRQESRYLRRIEDSTWRTEILKRASHIRDAFTEFLEEHGMEPAAGYDEDWVEGRGVIDYAGSST